MHILLTGGTGFIGSHLAEKLLAQGHRVSVLTTASVPHPNLAQLKDRIHWVWGSFNNRMLMYEALQGVDAVFHLAWTTVPKDASDNPIYDIESNVVGGLHLLDACVHNRVGQFLFISTGGALYGLPRYTPINESHPIEPVSSYGISKATFERYLHFYFINKGLKYRIFRISNAYGERQNLTKNQGVIGLWLQNIKNNQPIQIWGDGSAVRDYLYVSDIAQALVQGLSYSGESPIFNLGYGHGFSLNHIIKIMEQVTQKPIAVEFHPTRSFDVPVNVLDISLIKRELNWQPLVSLEQGIAAVWKWLHSS